MTTRIYENPLEIERTMARAAVERANTLSMAEIMQETGFIVGPTAFPNWRPTKRSEGTIPGVNLPLIIVATDGILGLYLQKDRPSVDYFIGHISHFTGKVEILHSLQHEAKPKCQPGRTKIKSQRQLLLESI